METKTCSCCKKEKPLTKEYYYYIKTRRSFAGHCKECYAFKERAKKQRVNVGEERGCEHCGVTYTPQEPRQVYCSKECGVNGRRVKNGGKRGEPLYFICKHCGKKFKRKTNSYNVFCSQKCHIEYIQTEPTVKICNACGNEYDYKKHRNPKHCSERCEKKSKEIRSICKCCGKEFITENKIRRYCSELCSRVEQEKRLRESYRRSEKHKGKKVKFKCDSCGKVIYNKYGEKRRRFCSSKCGKKLGKYERKMRQRKAYVERVTLPYLLQRDAMTCGICGKKVRINVDYLHPRVATIDHIVPLAKGGEHSKRNTQLAHRECNSLKGVDVVSPMKLIG